MTRLRLRSSRLGSTAAVLPLLLLSCGAGSFPVDGARAHRRVVFQVEAGPRIPGTPGHAKVRAWLESELKRTGARVEVQSFTDTVTGRALVLENVIGRYGAAPTANGPGELVLCAHYDSRPWSDEDPDVARRSEPVPGANDGGSGVAVLLEVAELFAKRPPPCPVALVFFDGEDGGRPDQAANYSRGAAGYAARAQAPLPRAAFLFDMVGDRHLAIHPEATGASRAANLSEMVWSAAQATQARSFHPQPRYHLVDDHIALLDRGIPAVDIVDFDYPAWHTTKDLPDQVSEESLAEVARVAAWLAYSSPISRLR